MREEHYEEFGRQKSDISQHVWYFSFGVSNWNRFSIRYWKAPWHQCIAQRLFGWHLVFNFKKL